MKFRKKPVVVEAWQHTRDADENLLLINMAEEGDCRLIEDGEESSFEVYNHKHEQWLRVVRDDWVISASKDDIYPCKPDIFEATYEAVDD